MRSGLVGRDLYGDGAVKREHEFSPRLLDALIQKDSRSIWFSKGNSAIRPQHVAADAISGEVDCDAVLVPIGEGQHPIIADNKANG